MISIASALIHSGQSLTNLRFIPDEFDQQSEKDFSFCCVFGGALFKQEKEDTSSAEREGKRSVQKAF